MTLTERHRRALVVAETPGGRRVYHTGAGFWDRPPTPPAPGADGGEGSGIAELMLLPWSLWLDLFKPPERPTHG